jgi:hypothetical protein
MVIFLLGGDQSKGVMKNMARNCIMRWPTSMVSGFLEKREGI